LISYRSFRNTDPPALAALWRVAALGPGYAQPLTTAGFEQCVLSKPYFENDGLIVACDGPAIVGFVHAGFGPGEEGRSLCRDMGVICQIMVQPDYQRQGIGGELVERAEAYLRRRGAMVLYAGSLRPMYPFYMGIYGGSDQPGLLDSEASARGLLEKRGYRRIDGTVIYSIDLESFKQPIHRRFMQLRRAAELMEETHSPENWWDACVWSGIDRRKYTLRDREGNLAATATVWPMDYFSPTRGGHTAGISELEVLTGRRRGGLATLLVSEVLMQLKRSAFYVAEVLTMENNSAARGLYLKLGFKLVRQGSVYRKEGSAPPPSSAIP
jgi:ribosomal protein S18 acetylase RimI-like enzyme